MTKRTASELWDALDEATLDAEMESVLAMTPEERRRELVAAGYDIVKVHADADAFFESLPARIAAAAAASTEPAASTSPAAEALATPVSTASPVTPASAAAPPAPAPPAAVVVPTPSTPAPLPAPAAPAAKPARPAKSWRRPAILVPTALALAAGAALTFQALSPEVVIAPHPDDPPAVRAAALRRAARGSCEAQAWKVCVDRLDDARTLDPAGDDTPDVRALRHAAAEGVGHP